MTHLEFSSELLLEIRRLVATNRSLTLSSSKKITEITAAINMPNADLDNIKKLVVTDPGLSMKVIRLANCTIRQGLARKRQVSVKEALNRIGVSGIKSAIILYRMELLKSYVLPTWIDIYESKIVEVIEIATAAYLISLELGCTSQEAEQSMSLSVFYSVGIFANILAASSLNVAITSVFKDVVLEPNAKTSAMVVMVNNGHHNLIKEIEAIGNYEIDTKSNLIPSIVRSAWDLGLDKASEVTLLGKTISKKEVFFKCQ